MNGEIVTRFEDTIEISTTIVFAEKLSSNKYQIVRLLYDNIKEYIYYEILLFGQEYNM